MIRGLLHALQIALALLLVANPVVGWELSESHRTDQEATSAGGESAQIVLEGDTAVAGSMTVQGLVSTDAGVRFPDSTIQTTASPGGAATANQGLYSNRITAFAPPYAYTEVCFGDSGFRFDVHSIGESTDGGNCLPGDTGFVIERAERDDGALVTWLAAKSACLAHGMRLLEPFEWQFACDNAAVLELERMTFNQWEWVSNSSVPSILEYYAFYALGFGNYSCLTMRGGRTATVSSSVPLDQFEVRCGR
ncbi:MAG: hypothetical protein AAGF23_12560 [Acidobacteriota bacterium]